MLYMIVGQDAADSLPKRVASRQQHLARLEQLQNQGRLILAGPLPAIDAEDPGPAGFTGSLVVAEFDSLDQARQWADADPYIESGAWVGSDVRPFLQVRP